MEINNRVFQTSATINRRSFLRLSGLLGLGMASAGIALPAVAEAVKFDQKNYKVSKTRLAMGTFVSMTLIHPSRDEAEEAIGRANKEIDRLVRLMNRFDETTVLSQLNNDGYLKDLPPEIAQVIARSLYFHKISQGAFDISVKPLIDIFQEKVGKEKKFSPAKRELEQAMELVDSNKIELNGRSIYLKKPGMGITLDGIGKGYIIDKASEILTGYKIKNFLINAGGDIRTMGRKNDKKPWAIAIQDPQKKKQYPDIIQMTDGAIATSGNYEVYFDREKMFHHIVDPKTGISPELNAGVSVTADTVMDADALSTSVFVMRPTDGTRFIDSIPGSECLIITKSGKILKSSKWKNSAI